MNTQANSNSNVAMKANLVYYREVQSAAREAGLKTGGKLAELISRLEEAGITVPSREVETAVPEPTTEEPVTLATAIAEAAKLQNDGLRVAKEGNDLQNSAKLALQGLAAVVAAKQYLAAVGLEVPMPADADIKIRDAERRGGQMIESGLQMMAWGDAMEVAFAQLSDAAQQLIALGVTLPQELVDVMNDAPKYTPMRRQAQVHPEADVLAEMDAAWDAYEAAGAEEDDVEWVVDEEDDDLVDDDGGDEPLGPLHRYEFVLDGLVYEGRCTVEGLNVQHAKQRILNDDIVSGDRWSENEFDPGDEEKMKALLAVVNTTGMTSGYGHTITLRIIS